MNTFRDVIDCWQSNQILADDIGEKLGTVRKWRVRDSIPPDKWEAVIDMARRRRIKGITAQLFIRLAARRNGNQAA